MITPLFIISLLVLITIAGIACFYARRPLLYLAVLVLTAVFVPLSYGAFASLLGKPKPTNLEWAASKVDAALVLGSVVRENVGIFVFMLLPGEMEPMSYKLPWDERAAEQLQKAEAESSRQGQKGAMIHLPFEPTLDPEAPRFYPVPQPAMPEKQAPTEKPQVFERAT